MTIPKSLELHAPIQVVFYRFLDNHRFLDNFKYMESEGLIDGLFKKPL